MGAALVVTGGVDRHVVTTYVKELLLPTLQQGDIVLLDNLPAHHASELETSLQAKGCLCLYRAGGGGVRGKVDYFVNTVFNYLPLAECYKTAAFDGLNQLG